MLECVIFDMDGVIIDSQGAYFEIERKLFRDLGINVSDEEHHSFVGIPIGKMWSHLKGKHGFDGQVGDLVEMEMRIYTEYLLSDNCPGLIPGVAKLVKDLFRNSARIAVASSSSRKAIEIVLRISHLERFFSATVSGDEVKNGKPAPDIFVYAASILGVEPGECIVIEDSKSGVQAARSAGMSCVGFHNPNSGKQDLSFAHMVIDSFFEISYMDLKRMHRRWQENQ